MSEFSSSSNFRKEKWRWRWWMDNCTLL